MDLTLSLQRHSRGHCCEGAGRTDRSSGTCILEGFYNCDICFSLSPPPCLLAAAAKIEGAVASGGGGAGAGAGVLGGGSGKYVPPSQRGDGTRGGESMSQSRMRGEEGGRREGSQGVEGGTGRREVRGRGRHGVEGGTGRRAEGGTGQRVSQK